MPGWFFFGWATWWMIGVFRAYMASSGKAPYSARAWYDFPWAKSIPLEPILKVVLTFIGINGELWFGHESWRFVLLMPPMARHMQAQPVKACKVPLSACRTLHGADGRFIVDNINEWQHSAMYLAFLISGAVDLVGFYASQGTLPPGTEQVHFPALSTASTSPACRCCSTAHLEPTVWHLGSLMRQSQMHAFCGVSPSAPSRVVPPPDH